MKKTVQIVTILLDKEGWSKNDIVMMSGTIQFPIYAMESDIDDCQAQQLLVLSGVTDEIEEGDWIIHDDRILLNVVEVRKVANTLYGKDNDGYILSHCKKVIASYPHIEGTLPISKETVQAWIDAGTPEEGSVEVVDWNCLRPDICKCYNQQKFYPYCKYYKDSNGTKLDSKGNLLLEFDKGITRSMQGYSHGDFEDEIKPSIPTDEEIRKTARALRNQEFEKRKECLAEDLIIDPLSTY